MKYKDIMGYTKKQPKKKVVKEKLSPKQNKILESVKKELNEWSHQPPTEKRWSKKFNGSQGLTEFEKKGGKDFVNETLPAMSREWKNIEKAEKVYQKAIMDLSKAVSKVDRKHSKTISGLWRYVEGPMKKFKELISKEVLDKLQ
tara:strand:+ start:451 stop:882 length:432 start_codon:yes stop_codon:yes gene_type:complete